MTEQKYRPATVLVHQGQDRDPATGAATVPIYQASTYHHDGGQPGQYDYARSGNPSREQVEDAIALLEGGVRGFAYASGMTAIGSALALLESGDHLIASASLYGGSWRFITGVLPQKGIQYTLVDTTDPDKVKAAIKPNTRALFLETPSNPLFEITDLRAMAELAKSHNLISMLDNTFMTPLLQRPLDLGIDISIHSATKFLGGHSDILAGLSTTSSPALGKKLKYFQNAFGAVLSPFDAFLLSRGIKTLKVRLDAAQNSAAELANRLMEHSAVNKVWFPGLKNFPQQQLHFSQSTGPGAVLSFELKEDGQVHQLLNQVKLPIIAPSLGGVETILTHCWSMSHGALPAKDKLQQGITKRLLRLSVGLEDIDDLWEDLEQGLSC